MVFERGRLAQVVNRCDRCDRCPIKFPSMAMSYVMGPIASCASHQHRTTADDGSRTGGADSRSRSSARWCGNGDSWLAVLW